MNKPDKSEPWRIGKYYTARLHENGRHLVVVSDSPWKRGAEMRASVNPKGYRQVTLGRCYGEHAIVADRFLGPRPPGMEINHKDGDKQNNSPDNLEYVTPKENTADAIRRGVHCASRPEKNPNYKDGRSLDPEYPKRWYAAYRERKRAALAYNTQQLSA